MYLLTGNAAAALSPRAVYAVPTFLQKGGGLKTSVLVYPVLLMRKQCWNKEWYLKINIWVQHTDCQCLHTLCSYCCGDTEPDSAGGIGLLEQYIVMFLTYITKHRHYCRYLVQIIEMNWTQTSDIQQMIKLWSLSWMSISHVLADFLLPLLSSHSARRNWRCKLVFCSWSSRLFAVESFRLRADIQIRNMFRQGSEVFSVKLLYLFH